MNYKYSFLILLFFSLNLAAEDFCAQQIKIANTHLVNKQRIKMAKALNKAIDNKRCFGQKQKLKDKLTKYFEFFLTDEAQNNYEKAKEAFKNTPQESETLLLKTLENKQHNLLSIELLQRVYFKQDRCGKAYKLSLELEGITPYLYRNKKRLFLSLVCLKNYKKALALKRHFLKNEDLYYQLLFVEAYYGLDMEKAAKEILLKINSKKHPEVIGWKILLEKSKEKKLKFGREYKDACTRFSNDIHNEYWDLKKPCENPLLLDYLKDSDEV